ncbi:MAG: hypothetical protein WA125_05475 [Desulfosporosinus sp.]
MVNAEKYKICSADGTSVELASNELSQALVYVNEQGSLSFTSGTPGKQTVSEPISIEFLH